MDEYYKLAKSPEVLLDELMEKHGTKVLRLVYFLVKDQSFAEDITQEVFLKVFRQIDTFRGDSAIQTWIYQIAVNESKGYLRSWSFRKIFPSWNLQRESEITVEAEVMQRVDKETIVHQVLKLPAVYRQIIALHYYADMSIEEVALVLRVSQGTVRTRLHRARQKLRGHLEKEGITWTSRDSYRN